MIHQNTKQQQKVVQDYRIKKNEEEPTMVTKSQGRGPEEELSFSPSTSQGCVLR